MKLFCLRLTIFFFFSSFAISMVSAKNENKAIMCYFGSWSTYRWSYGHFDVEDIDPFLCTHIVYGFAVLDKNTFQMIAHDSYVDEDKGKDFI